MGGIYVGALIAAFVLSALFKMNWKPWAKEFTVNWNDSMGKVCTDLAYGEKESNKFDLYVLSETSLDNYGLVVCLHVGGFTFGSELNDAEMLKWLCSKGYVAAGINYTLFGEATPMATSIPSP